MSQSQTPPRPPTPQAFLHRLPDMTPGLSLTKHKPSKYIILLMGSTAAAGKVQIARSLAEMLSCPLYQGDSLHDSSAKAASIGTAEPATRSPVTTSVSEVTQREDMALTAKIGSWEALRAEAADGVKPIPNKARYQRMWLSKLTRTGLLFPEESRPANEGFSGFGGASSTSTSRRGSASSEASFLSGTTPSSTAESIDFRPALVTSAPVASTASPASRLNRVFTISDEERRRRANPALMVLTHPELESWHKQAIRTAVGDYGIGVIFVPLYAEIEEVKETRFPTLRPLDPTKMTSFSSSFGAFSHVTAGARDTYEQLILSIDVDADVDTKTAEVIAGVERLLPRFHLTEIP